jgi:protoporphyrinogen oxidase
MIEKRTEIVILGGGISGVAAMKTALKRNLNCILLEKSPNLGGLTRSIYIGDYIFDYTGHFLHLSKFSKPSEIGEGFDDNYWLQITKNAKCYFSNTLIDAPFQYNLFQLPEKLYSSFIQDYLNRQNKSIHSNSTFPDYLINNFGEKIAEAFLIPYNEKLLATDLNRISHNAVTRFFPPPKKELILSTKNSDNGNLYNSKFWYPKSDGIQLLTNSLSYGLSPKRINTSNAVCRINLKEQIVTTQTGDEMRYDMLISSLPLNILISKSELNNKYGKYLNTQITAATVLSLHIGINAPIPEDYADVHWIYYSEKEFPFYRVGFYSNFNDVMAPKGKYSIYVEVGTESRLNNLNDRIESVIKNLERVKILREKDIEVLITNYMMDGYVHYTTKREEIISEILTELGKKNVTTIGRYGKWQYSSMEDSIIEGVNSIEKL